MGLKGIVSRDGYFKGSLTLISALCKSIDCFQLFSCLYCLLAFLSLKCFPWRPHQKSKTCVNHQCNQSCTKYCLIFIKPSHDTVYIREWQVVSHSSQHSYSNVDLEGKMKKNLRGVLHMLNIYSVENIRTNICFSRLILADSNLGGKHTENQRKETQDL